MIRVLLLVLLSLPVVAHAGDPQGDQNWPRWRGPQGNGVWQGPKLPEQWPKSGLKKLWEQPVGGGYGGVAVADDRVLVLDHHKQPEEVERLLCCAVDDGRTLWWHAWDVKYGDLSYGNGPRTTPTVADGRVYVLGALGHVLCLDVTDGSVIWQRDFSAELKKRLPMWALSGSPVLFEDLVVLHLGLKDGCVIALDRRTGETRWQSIADKAGYATPVLIKNHDRDELIVWTSEAVQSVSPQTGESLWSVPYKSTYGVAIATPIWQEGILFVSGYWEGSVAIRPPADAESKPEILWKDNRELRGLMSQPLYRDGKTYLLDKRFGLTCFELKTGKKLWDDKHQATPRDRNPQATLVWLGDENRVIILNALGELILARLSPAGFEESSRTKIIGKTWAHPAYAGNRVFARSDTKLVCFSLTEAADTP